MTEWINYHHLYYFKTIAEEGSVSKAARKLRLGQPTLSAQLKQFESNLGVDLFTRKQKRLHLTEQGKVALKYAQHIFKLGHEMNEMIKDRLVPARPHLQIGALDSIPKQILTRMATLGYRIANCKIRLTEGKEEELLKDLASHKIDIVVTNALPTKNLTKEMRYKSFTSRQVSVFGSAAYKSLKKNFPRSLIGKPFIMSSYDSPMRYQVDHWFDAHKIPIDTIAETQDIALKKMMAVDGLGLIPVSYESVARQVENKELFEIGKLDGLKDQLFFITTEKLVENPILSQLMKDFKIQI